MKFKSLGGFVIGFGLGLFLMSADKRFLYAVVSTFNPNLITKQPETRNV